MTDGHCRTSEGKKVLYESWKFYLLHFSLYKGEQFWYLILRKRVGRSDWQQQPGCSTVRKEKKISISFVWFVQKCKYENQKKITILQRVISCLRQTHHGFDVLYFKSKAATKVLVLCCELPHFIWIYRLNCLVSRVPHSCWTYKESVVMLLQLFKVQQLLTALNRVQLKAQTSGWMDLRALAASLPVKC